MSSSMNSIIEQLPSLTNEELQAVRDTATFLTDNTKQNKPTDWEAKVFQAFNKQLSTSGIQTNLHYASFRRTSGYKAWIQSISKVETFITNNFGTLKNIERLALLNLFYKLLIDNMNEINVPITINTVSSHTKRIPEVFNMNFPGYIASGLAPMVLATMRKRNGNNHVR